MRPREPFNSWSHLVGLVLAAIGTVLLLRSATGPAERAAFAVYGASLVLLYAASTVYHWLPFPPARLRPFRVFDHIAIYFLIAGTYTPVLLVTLHGALGWALFTIVWAIALAGVPFKLVYLDAPRWLSTATYLTMGWLAVIALAPLARIVSPAGLAWLGAGGLAYTGGAIVFTTERPNPLPGRFGHHEIWHLFVLVGSGCHFAFMALHVGAR